MQGQECKSMMSLKRKINQRWKQFDKDYCAKLLDDMPLKVDAIIKRPGEQISQEDYRNKKNKNKKQRKQQSNRTKSKGSNR